MSLSAFKDACGDIRIVATDLEHMAMHPGTFDADRFFGMLNELRCLISKASDAGMDMEATKKANDEEFKGWVRDFAQ